jgi:hypothetical protein
MCALVYEYANVHMGKHTCMLRVYVCTCVYVCIRVHVSVCVYMSAILMHSFSIKSV